MKTKLRGRVHVVQEGNNKVNARDDVFQMDELVYTYRVALSTDLEENSNFHIARNIFNDVNIEELNNVLRTNGHAKVDEDDDIDEHQFNEIDFVGHGDDKIKEEEEEEEHNSD